MRVSGVQMNISNIIFRYIDNKKKPTSFLSIGMRSSTGVQVLLSIVCASVHFSDSEVRFTKVPSTIEWNINQTESYGLTSMTSVGFQLVRAGSFLSCRDETHLQWKSVAPTWIFPTDWLPCSAIKWRDVWSADVYFYNVMWSTITTFAVDWQIMIDVLSTVGSKHYSTRLDF